MSQKTWYNKHMQKGFTRGGFTIVELSLSIVFIAILSISVVLIMTNAIASYHRGLTLNQVNTTGMELVDDMRASIQNSPAQSVKSRCDTVYSSSTVAKECRDDGGRNFVSVARYATVTKKDSKDSDKRVGGNNGNNGVPVFGAFCTGSYSYIWNSGYFFSEDYDVSGVGKAKLAYKEVGGGSVTRDDFKLLKVKDENRAVCVSATKGAKENRYSVKTDTGNGNNINGSSTGNVFDITGENYSTVDEELIDLLSGSNNLAVYSIMAMAPAESTASNALFYSVSFVLGTVQGGINILSTGNFCTAPEDYNNAALENFDYCAINKFNFAAEATGG